MYAKAGEIFDLATIEDMVQKRTLAIGVRVIRGAKTEPKRVTGLSMSRIGKKKKERAA
jgi:hypothetical protein